MGELERVLRGNAELKMERDLKQTGGLFRQGVDVMFGFMVKHRGAWPVAMMCKALGVFRSAFYGWLLRAPSHCGRDDEEMELLVCQSFIASDRTYGARPVWFDVLELGYECGLHRNERLM